MQAITGRYWSAPSLALRRRLIRCRAGAAFVHELVELRLVTGKAQALEEGREFLLLLLQPPQRLGAVFVEGVVAGRGWPPGVLAPVAPQAPRRLPALAARPGRCPVASLTAPFGVMPPAPTRHPTTPQVVTKDRQAHRPEHDEAQHHSDDGQYPPRTRIPRPGAGPPRATAVPLPLGGPVAPPAASFMPPVRPCRTPGRIPI